MTIIREATPTDAPGIARVHIDSWRTTYRGLVPDSYLASLRSEDRQRMWERALNDPSYRGFLYVAEAEDGNVVGFAAGGPSRSEDVEYEGELYAIYILEDYQGKGIGRRLVKVIAERLTSAGIHSMLVWVLTGNPAQRFYEALGGEELRRQQFDLEGMTLDEVSYGWKDIFTILGRV